MAVLANSGEDIYLVAASQILNVSDPLNQQGANPRIWAGQIYLDTPTGVNIHLRPDVANFGNDVLQLLKLFLGLEINQLGARLREVLDGQRDPCMRQALP